MRLLCLANAGGDPWRCTGSHVASLRGEVMCQPGGATASKCERARVSLHLEAPGNRHMRPTFANPRSMCHRQSIANHRLPEGDPTAIKHQPGDVQLQPDLQVTKNPPLTHPCLIPRIGRPPRGTHASRAPCCRRQPATSSRPERLHTRPRSLAPWL